MELQTRPVPQPDVIVQQSGDAQVLLHVTTGRYYSLDDVGARIWALCDGARSVSDIVGVLCDEYDAPREDIAGDALELLGELETEKLVAAS